MPDTKPLVKAKLSPLDRDFKNVVNRDRAVIVQFNPETLKMSFANKVDSPGAGDQSGTAAKQFVGTGTTKLSLQLWFDLSAPLPDGQPNVSDVRDLTQKVVYFISPQDDKQPIEPPPGVRFEWGSFVFDGIVESLEESLEFFSNDGHPLRASMSLVLAQQKILKHTPASSGGPAGALPGTRPLTEAQAGATLQGLADRLGNGANWQSIAAANGIENPRLLKPGQLIDIRVGN